MNNQIWIVYGYDHFQLVTEYKNPDKGIEYNINVVGDRTNIAQYYDEIPGYNKDGTNIELVNLTADIKEYIVKYIERDNDDSERKETLFAILSSHYLNKVIVIDDFQFSGRQLIDTGKEEDFKEMVKDDVQERWIQI